ncbi:hypothetical protein [uncultured Legionella sp.]|mgnify:CR=1 FL=1|uniref:hypothetical protein n=1 Tax=uncultured Legionella sp. TaxID=210934 RepID=UPI0026208C17|nr:hypothetical protein [uncultured Legionella sp.]
MPGNFKRFNSKECIRAIMKFLDFTQETGIDNSQSLSDLIVHFLDKTYVGILSKHSHIKAVADIKEICETKHSSSQSNFLLMLTTACYQHVHNARIDNVLSGTYCPAQIMAAFHHEAITNEDDPIQFSTHLELQAGLSVQQRAAILLCINWYAPDLILFGNFVDSPYHQLNFIQLQNIINCLPHNVSLTYANNCLGKIKDNERRVFLDSVAKASSLALNATGLNQWSDKDWEDFVRAVVKNEHLSSISLNNNQLYQSCTDPKKFDCILRLFAVPHLKELYLHNNNLELLPFKQFQLLQRIISQSSIVTLGLRHIPEVKTGALSAGGIFAVGKPVIPEPDRDGPEGDMSKSGEFQIEGYSIQYTSS